MASKTSNRAVFKSVVAKRQALIDAKQFSEQDGRGAKVAILMPYIDNFFETREDRWELFERDAAALEAHYKSIDRSPFTIMRAMPEDFERVFQDRSVPNLVIRAGGSFSKVFVPVMGKIQNEYGEEIEAMVRNYLDWRDVSRMTNHLKLGTIVMRSCGRYWNTVNIPIPYAAVPMASSIHAAAGKSIYPVGMHHPDNALIQPLTFPEDLTYDEIKSFYPQEVATRRESVIGVPTAWVPAMAYEFGRGVHRSMSSAFQFQRNLE